VADNVKKLPGDISHLQRLIGNHAPDRGMPPARLQRWLNVMIVTAVLDRVRDEDGKPIFLLKGGLALELRLQLRARATGDYDAAFRTRTEEVIDLLDEALAAPWKNFQLTRDAPETIPNTKAVRVRLRLSYKGRTWGSVQLEMAPVEGRMGLELDHVKAMSLVPLQIPLPEAANCVSLRYQAAQKLNACTEVFDEGRENDRFRDVMDILLVEDLLYDVGLARVREACVDIFTVRDKHTWPPTVTVYDSWRVPFAELARENGFTPEAIDEATAALGALIAAIESASSAS
jgi:Nucleotidyl transferase AbiEii toxin, Type IV TA system